MLKYIIPSGAGLICIFLFIMTQNNREVSNLRKEFNEYKETTEKQQKLDFQNEQQAERNRNWNNFVRDSERKRMK